MQIEFHGAAGGEVTGSCHLIEVAGKRILLDCGMLQGSRDAEARKEIHVGPLFSIVERAEEKRVAVGNGLFGWKRDTAAGRWHFFFWWDFGSRSANSASPASR